ncbi:MAG: hypothetical protein AAF495_27870 [Pseudomonadota bacterium]
MGLARDQQHAQAVAHAVDHHGRAVVGQGQLLGARFDRKLQYARAPSGQLEFDLLLLADRHRQDARLAAVLANLHLSRRGARPLWQILDAKLQGLGLADDAVARHLGHHDPAVAFLFKAGQIEVQWRVQAERLEALGHVVNLAVADQHDGADALARHLGEALAQGVE